MAGAAIAAGLTVIEVTLDSERPLDQIASIKAAFPDAEVGAGSVRKAPEVSEAVDAGASFIVSPIVDEDTIAAARELGIAVFPGAATPTEIEQAMRHGATAVKVFPIEQLGGPAYVRAILSPLGSPPLIPTGGVTVDSMTDYLRAGAVAVGLGGTLFPKSALESGDTATVAKLAMDVIEAMR
jgi:2-dehydro-3-deoxyphosphogluconate aldolase/(4S)-4-hydroxy-2-oxoglutarate aldolase